MDFMLIAILSSWYFSWSHCSGYFTTWLGLLPLEIIVTAAMVLTPCTQIQTMYYPLYA
jgi:hypothetical protein